MQNYKAVLFFFLFPLPLKPRRDVGSKNTEEKLLDPTETKEFVLN